MQEEIDLGPHRVVANHEDQYSLLPVGHALPAGWRDANCQGSKAQCLAYIREAWTDLRPRSVRRTD
ncbi:MAG TPA: MbtH family NRPS accessory protein [Lysobacter sp.]|jgi:MbtH protein|nr:MbtH family NRPS accessory protein [Lysobacter sp.]